MREAQRLVKLWAQGHRARVLRALTKPDGSLDKQTLAFMLDSQVHAYRELLDAWQKNQS